MLKRWVPDNASSGSSISRSLLGNTQLHTTSVEGSLIISYLQTQAYGRSPYPLDHISMSTISLCLETLWICLDGTSSETVKLALLRKWLCDIANLWALYCGVQFDPLLFDPGIAALELIRYFWGRILTELFRTEEKFTFKGDFYQVRVNNVA